MIHTFKGTLGMMRNIFSGRLINFPYSPAPKTRVNGRL